MEVSATLGRNLLAARKSLGITQAELADASGHTRATVVLIEQGETAAIRLSTIVDIASVLGVSPFLLFLSEDDFDVILRIVDGKYDLPEVPKEKLAMLALLGANIRRGVVGVTLKVIKDIINDLKPKYPGLGVGAAIGTMCRPVDGIKLGLALGSGVGELFERKWGSHLSQDS
jgi:transcriptional regulator with XRE-family HTH domain